MHLATCPNQNSPTDSADEAVFDVTVTDQGWHRVVLRTAKPGARRRGHFAEDIYGAGTG